MLTRREMLKVLLAGAGGLAAYWLRPAWPVREQRRPRRLGTTFSPLQCAYLDLDVTETFQAVASLGLDVVRLCAYWRTLEPRPEVMDFSSLDKLLDMSARAGMDVVLAVGMKAPRWPEFHFPLWVEALHNTTRTDAPLDQDPKLAELALSFLSRVVEHVRAYPHVRVIQVENEPFNRVEVAGGRYLSRDFVRQEVALVRALLVPGQKVMLTTAIDLFPLDPDDDEAAFAACAALADVVGINVYTRVPVNASFYLRPLPSYWRKLRSWQERLVRMGREPWVAEAQAEPWEWNHLVVKSLEKTPSASPERTTALVERLARLGYDTVLLWGCEYWYWRKCHGDLTWWNRMAALARASRAQP